LAYLLFGVAVPDQHQSKMNAKAWMHGVRVSGYMGLMKQACCVFLVLAFMFLGTYSPDPKVMRDRCVASADKYFGKGKYQEASLLYRRALQFDPKFAEAYYRLGKAQTALRKYVDAARSFARAASLDPGNEDAAVRLAEFYITAYVSDLRSNKRSLAEAKPLVAQILRRNPNSYGGLRLAADLANIADDPEAAIRKLRQADSVKPGQAEVIVPLMQDLAAVGRQPEAERVGEEFIARNKTVTAIYDLLFVYYRQSSRFDRAEEILKARMTNLATETTARLQLAAFYYSRDREAEMNALLDGLRSDRKSFPHADILMGDFYTRIGEFDSAIRAYREGEKSEPQLASDYEKRIADVLIAQGRDREALAIVSKLHNNNPRDVEAAAIHASLLAAGNALEVQTAIGELEALVGQQSGIATLHFHLARAYWIKGDQASLDRAVQHFETSLKLNAGFLPAKIGLARVQLARGQNGVAVRIAGEILESSPMNHVAKLIRSAGLMNLGEGQKARQELMSILKIDKGSNEARYQLASLDLSEKRYHEAEAGFQALAQVGDARGITGFADCKEARGQPTIALKFVEQELVKHPERDAYRLAIADLEIHMGRFEEAQTQLEQLVRKSPAMADIQVRLGTVQSQLGDKPAALHNFETAHQLQPSNATAALGYALLLEQVDQIEQARAVYEDLLKSDPDNATALNNLSYIEAEQGVDLNQALSYAQHALQLSPKDPNISDTLGLIYIRKKLTSQAVQVLQELVARVPDNPSFHLHLGMALYEAGKKNLAKNELEKALRHKPSAHELAKIQELVRRIG
jgi:tetratricopeptide (TPR) repeat protein